MFLSALCMPVMVTLEVIVSAANSMCILVHHSVIIYFYVPRHIKCSHANVIVLEKRSNFAPNFNFELRVPLNRAVWEL